MKFQVKGGMTTDTTCHYLRMLAMAPLEWPDIVEGALPHGEDTVLPGQAVLRLQFWPTQWLANIFGTSVLFLVG